MPLVLIVGVIVAVQKRAVVGPVYSVAQVQAGLARHPSAWVGRTILMRGTIEMIGWSTGSGGSGDGCATPLSCVLHAPTGTTIHLFVVADRGYNSPRALTILREGLLDQHEHETFLFPYPPPPPNLVLRTRFPPPSALMLILRRMPWVSSLLPQAGTIDGGVSHIYQVRLLATHPITCVPQPMCTGVHMLVDEGMLVGTPP